MHRWLAGRVRLWEGPGAADVYRLAHPLIEGCRGSADPEEEVLLLIQALLLAVGAEPADERLLGKLGSEYVAERWRFVAAVLWLAGIMAADLRRLPPAVSDLIGTGMEVPLPDVQDAAGRLVGWVQLRMARQELLARASPPHLWVVMDETVLRRPVGSPVVMRAQLGRLIDATGQPGITLQVLPFAAGAHPAMHGLFYVFRFPAPELPDVVYGENMTSAFYLDKPSDAATYLQALDRVCAQAAPVSQTPILLRTIRKEI